MWRGWNQVGEHELDAADPHDEPEFTWTDAPHGVAGVGFNRAGGYQQLFGDHQGSVKTPWKDNPVYEPFGEVARGQPGVAKGFQNQEWREESGLYYMRHRWYDPVSKRFLSRDPVVQDTVENFGFVMGSPVMSWDPMGEARVPAQRGEVPGRGEIIIWRQTPNVSGGRIAAALGKYHEFAQTDSWEAGMGNARGVPGAGAQTTPDRPLAPTYIVDHSGRAFDPNVIGGEYVTGIDLAAFDTYFVVGEYSGRWRPFSNDCNTRVEEAIRNSTPQIPYLPSWIPMPGSWGGSVVIDARGRIRAAGAVSRWHGLDTSGYSMSAD